MNEYLVLNRNAVYQNYESSETIFVTLRLLDLTEQGNTANIVDWYVSITRSIWMLTYYNGFPLSITEDPPSSFLLKQSTCCGEWETGCSKPQKRDHTVWWFRFDNALWKLFFLMGKHYFMTIHMAFFASQYSTYLYGPSAQGVNGEILVTDLLNHYVR